MTKQALALLTFTSFFVAACASGRVPVSETRLTQPVVPADASVRVVSGDTTWVTRGSAYEIVARSPSDLGLVRPMVDQEAQVLQRVFANDTLLPLVITVRHEGTGSPPIPTALPGMVVDLTLPAAGAGGNPGQRANSQRQQANGTTRERSVALPVARAWLSARASELTHVRADLSVANGSTEDPRVPPWALAAIPMLAGNPDMDRTATSLAAHIENLYPLAEFLSMARPEFVASSAQTERPNPARGEGSGGGGAGGEAGGRGGRGMGGSGGGRGGMGGGGGRGGMGGNRGSGQSGGQQRAPALQGAALFSAQSYAFARYLAARESYAFIGAFIDTQITGKSVDDFLTERKTFTLPQMQADWQRWVSDYAASVTH